MDIQMFNVCFGLENLKTKSAKDGQEITYAILLADTMRVIEDGPAEVRCTGSSQSVT